MSILLPILAITFAAFCVWLTVRIVNRRERWAKWTVAGTIGLPVLYVLSFGPVCWITSTSHPRTMWVETLYRPITMMFEWGSSPISNAFRWYAQVGARNDCEWRPAASHDQQGKLTIDWLWIDNMP